MEMEVLDEFGSYPLSHPAHIGRMEQRRSREINRCLMLDVLCLKMNL